MTQLIAPDSEGEASAIRREAWSEVSPGLVRHRCRLAFPIHPDQLVSRFGPQRYVSDRPGSGDIELVLDNVGAQHADSLGHGDSIAGQREPVRIKGRRHDRIGSAVDQMPAWEVPSGETALDQNLTLAVPEPLNDDLGVLPAGTRTRRERV